MNVLQRFFHRPFFIRLFNWEYWSFGAIYTWIYPFWFYQCLRSRSLFFFAAANPRIKNGGFLNESKKEIVPLIPQQLQPRTLFFSIPANGDIVLNELRSNRLLYPLIGKPDIGGRGRGVKVLKDDEDVRIYVSRAAMNFHIQEYVSFRNEVGIFYHRIPGESNGTITGIVRKEFLSVMGDGSHTIRELLLKSKRALMYMESLDATHGVNLDVVLPAGEKRIVSPYGNHARGSLFLDDSALIDEQLIRTFDSICKQIPDFYYGRLDIRFDNWEDLKAGNKFAIIEVNGAGSEPTHIYDPKHSLLFAWKEIIRHWFILARISRINHRLGHPYLSTREGIQMFREDKEWSAKLEAMAD